MGNIKTFVESICDCYEKSVHIVEEEQKLPPRDVLEDVCQTLLNVSCLREEGRFPSFRVCFVRPDSELLDTYIYAHVLRFQNPIPFHTRELHKLAPALNAGMSYLMLDITEKPYTMIGIIASYTAWEKIVTREVISGNRMPRIPNIFVNGPGELRACFGESSIVCYSAGHCVFFRTDTFTSTLIADQLARDSHITQKERLQLLYRILYQVNSYGHGAAILIVPSAEACMEYIDLKYPMRSPYLFGDGLRPEKPAGIGAHPDKLPNGGANAEKLAGVGLDKPSGKARDKDIITYADLIAKFTSVDGAVVLTKDFDLVGFGAETVIDNMENLLPSMCFMNFDNTEDKFKHFKDHGMRHRAGYRFCNAVEGSVAFIISQDGTIEACTKNNGRVVVYDNVALPLL